MRRRLELGPARVAVSLRGAAAGDPQRGPVHRDACQPHVLVRDRPDVPHHALQPSSAHLLLPLLVATVCCLPPAHCPAMPRMNLPLWGFAIGAFDLFAGLHCYSILSSVLLFFASMRNQVLWYLFAEVGCSNPVLSFLFTLTTSLYASLFALYLETSLGYTLEAQMLLPMLLPGQSFSIAWHL